MKLFELLNVIDYNRESTVEKIQICRPDGNWDDCDEVSSSSALLIPLYQCKVTCLEAIEQNVIRIDIEWPIMKAGEKA